MLSALLSAGASLAGGVLGGWSSHRECECRVSFDSLPSPSEAVLGLLGQQLSRCGPEKLGGVAAPPAAACPACPACPGFPVVGYAVGLLAAVVVGFLLGVHCVQVRTSQRRADTSPASPAREAVDGVAANTPKLRKLLALRG